jgi:hypothetical protein
VPSHGTTTIGFDLPGATHARLRIFDVAGRCIRSLTQGSLAAGHYEVQWDARGETGRLVAGGIYIARLDWDGGQTSDRLLLVRP